MLLPQWGSRELKEANRVISAIQALKEHLVPVKPDDGLLQPDLQWSSYKGWTTAWPVDQLNTRWDQNLNHLMLDLQARVEKQKDRRLMSIDKESRLYLMLALLPLLLAFYFIIRKLRASASRNDPCPNDE